MLKPVLYGLLTLTTAIRFADLVYLLSGNRTNLPAPVIIVTAVMVLYGVLIAVKKFISTIRMKQFFSFYIVQSVVILFNLIYTSAVSPLRISVMETVLVGTFLDLLVNAGLIYAMFRQLRSGYLPQVRNVGGAAIGER